jgi:hypothetical protein
MAGWLYSGITHLTMFITLFCVIHFYFRLTDLLTEWFHGAVSSLNCLWLPAFTSHKLQHNCQLERKQSVVTLLYQGAEAWWNRHPCSRSKNRLMTLHEYKDRKAEQDNYLGHFTIQTAWHMYLDSWKSVIWVKSFQCKCHMHARTRTQTHSQTSLREEMG